MSFSSKADSTLHLELPNTKHVCFSKGYAWFYFTILTFKCLKSVTTYLSLVTFVLINITGPEYVEKPSFDIPK